MSRYLPFIEDGKTTKEEAIQKLGAPSAKFNGGAILTYKLSRLNESELGLFAVSRERDTHDFRIGAWHRAQYSLVLVFDGESLLKRHSLVRSR